MVQKRLEGTCGYTPSPRLQHFCTANNSHSQMNDTYPIESACYVARILTRKKISYNLSLLDLEQLIHHARYTCYVYYFQYIL